MKLGLDHREVASHAAQVAGLIAALVLFGNAKASWDLAVLQTTAAGSTFGIGAGIALVLAILAHLRARHGTTLPRSVWRAAAGARVCAWTVCPESAPGTAYRGTAAFASAALIVAGSLSAWNRGLRWSMSRPGRAWAGGRCRRERLCSCGLIHVFQRVGVSGAVLLALDGQNAQHLRMYRS